MLEGRSTRLDLHRDQFERTSSENIVENPENHCGKIEKGDAQSEGQLVLFDLAWTVPFARRCLIGIDLCRRSVTLRLINSVTG